MQTDRQTAFQLYIYIYRIEDRYKCTKRLSSYRVGTIVARSKKVLKQAGVVHEIKSIKTVVSLLCMPYQKGNVQ